MDQYNALVRVLRESVDAIRFIVHETVDSWGVEIDIVGEPGVTILLTSDVQRSRNAVLADRVGELLSSRLGQKLNIPVLVIQAADHPRSIELAARRERSHGTLHK